MKKQKVIRAICDTTEFPEKVAGIGDICLAIGMSLDPSDMERLTEMLRKEYEGYANVVPRDGIVRVRQRAFAENARYERSRIHLVQWNLASITAIAATLLGFFLGKFFGGACI